MAIRRCSRSLPRPRVCSQVRPSSYEAVIQRLPKCWLLVALAVSLTIVPCPQAGFAQDAATAPAFALEAAVRSAIAKAEGSVVSIARIRQSATELVIGPDNRATRLDPMDPDFVPNEFAAGIVIRGSNPLEPVVLTTYHAVKNGQRFGQPMRGDQSRLFVTFPGRKGCWATVFAADPRSDLAILSLDGAALRAGDLAPVPLEIGQAEGMAKGQFVVLLGNAYAIARDGSASASWGMISNIARRPPPDPLAAKEDARKAKPTIHYFGTLWQLDARLSLGMSGAAVLNLKGELVGIGSSLAALDGYEKSGGFAVPFDAGIRRVVETLVRGEEVEYGFLGVSLNRAPVVFPKPLEGFPRVVYGTQVEMAYPYSPAWNGRIETGDIVLEIGGVPILQGDDLMREVGLRAPGTSVLFTVLRDQQELQLPVRLGKWPVDWEEQIVASKPKRAAWRGLTIDYPTGRWKLMPQPVRFSPGVMVSQVVPESAAAKAGLTPGEVIVQVNDRAIASPTEFAAVVAEATGAVRLMLGDGRPVSIAVD